MIELGKTQPLTIKRITSVGAYMGETEETEEKKDVLLPKNELSETMQVGDSLEVFIYNDSEDRTRGDFA